MQLLDNLPTQQLETKQERLKVLVEQMINNLPVTLQGMALIYRGSVNQLVNNMDNEQIEDILDQIEEIIAYIKGGDTSAD